MHKSGSKDQRLKIYRAKSAPFLRIIIHAIYKVGICLMMHGIPWEIYCRKRKIFSKIGQNVFFKFSVPGQPLRPGPGFRRLRISDY